MSNEEHRFKHSKRLLKEDSAVIRQTKIAKAYGIEVKEPHKFAKHHAMSCGDPNCVMCANPRKVWKEKTFQEKKLEQDMD